MSSRKDPLFHIFEQHLFNAMVEDETTDDFLGRVVNEYVKSLSACGTIPREHRQTLEQDLREEVLEMLRKKTYGHFSLNEFRKKKMAASAAIHGHSQDGDRAGHVSPPASTTTSDTGSQRSKTSASTLRPRQRRSS